MVRRVRLGRRDGGRRALRWAGPPPLLVIATVAALAVTPFLEEGTAEAPAQVATASAESRQSPRAIDPRTIRPQRLVASQGGQASRGVAPVRLKKVPLGVASFNMYRKLSTEHARQDALALTRRDGVDVIGWQEAERFGTVLHDLPGWTTRTYPFGQGRSELAFSWRSSEFRFVSARQRQVARGVSWREGRYPFGNRLVATLTLEHLDTGRLLTVVNAHLPQAIEDLVSPGRWTPTINAYRARNQLQRIAQLWKGLPGRWVVGVGDYNFDADADARHRPRGGPRRALDGVAVSSFMKLGTDVAPTFPRNGRRIDYVWADQDAYAEGWIRFTGQFVVGGLNSDHRALVARLVLR